MHKVRYQMSASKNMKIKPNTGRIESIDILRGLTILVMIFVNDVASVTNLPQWLKHMPSDANGMTFVDIVFPAFLFIVGMSIPLALNKRIISGEPYAKIFYRLFVRVLGLLVLGFFMVNIGSLNEEFSGINKSVWTLLMFLAAILVWNSYPESEGMKAKLFIFLRIVGIITLVLLATVYRGGTVNDISWMEPKWWGILGLIGWAYLTASLVYLLFKNNLTAHTGVLALLIILFIGDRSGALEFLNFIKIIVLIGPFIGTHSSIVVAGIIVSLIFTSDNLKLSDTTKIKWTLAFAGMLFTAGYLLSPLYGVSKIYATPTWGLYSSAICAVLYCFTYWLIDMKRYKSWASFLKPAAINPLLAYILPSVFSSILAILNVKSVYYFFNDGISGIIRSITFSILILFITRILTNMKIRLHM